MQLPLNELVNSHETQGLLKGEDFYSIHMVFPIVCAFLDDFRSNKEYEKLKDLNRSYLELFVEIHCNSWSGLGAPNQWTGWLKKWV